MCLTSASIPVDKSSLENLFGFLRKGSSSDSVFVFLIFLNLVFTVVRFHDFPGMGFLGSIRLPLMLSLLCIMMVIPKLSSSWPRQMKVLSIFLVFEVIRGVVGKLIFDDLVINDGWHFHIWIDLFLTISSITFPIGFVFTSGSRIRALFLFLNFVGLLLGLWSITHSGTGPGGYLGDENDNCLALVTLLPIPFFLFSVSNNFISKIWTLFAGLVILLGSVATNSRGGFLGLLAVVFFQFLLSRNKLKWVVSSFLIALVSLPFVPEKYWNEIYSIKSDTKNRTGTIDERLTTWESITRMWLDPRNTLFGTGLENGKWNIHLYEGEEAGVSRRSVAGREAHCLYFQILGDLGIWGVFVYGVVILTSINTLRRLRKETKFSFDLMLSKLQSVGENDLSKLREAVMHEIKFIDLAASTIICSWIGLLVAGIGISVAYYPIIYLLTGFSVAVYFYWISIRDRVTLELIKDGK